MTLHKICQQERDGTVVFLSRSVYKGQESHGRRGNGELRVLTCHNFLEYGFVKQVICKVVIYHPDQR